MTTEMTHRSEYSFEVQRDRVLCTGKCPQVTCTSKPGGRKGPSGQSKDGKWQRTLGVWEAAGTGVKESTPPPAAGLDSLVFQKKLQTLSFSVTFLISDSICYNTIELNKSLGVSGSWASCF